MRTIRLTLQYDGTGYHGWQIQPGVPTIQGTLEQVLARMTGERIRVIGSGRTDRGVHALGQVASFRTSSTIPLEGLLKGMNSLLPPDIVVLEARECPEGFHALRDAKGKLYAYLLVTSPVRLPLLSSRAWVLPSRMDTGPVREALDRILGTHDFHGFQAGGSEVRSTVRTVTRAELTEVPIPPGIHPEAKGYLFLVEADGFLRYMVRNIVGLLVEIGRGGKGPETVDRVFETGDRALFGAPAPPSGLYLVKVYY